MDLGGTRNVGKNFHFERYKGAPEMRRKKLLTLNKFPKSISSEVAKLTKNVNLATNSPKLWLQLSKLKKI